MNERSKALYDFLVDKIPRDISYMDLAQLHLGFHVYTDGLPSDLIDGFDRDVQSEAFAAFVRDCLPNGFAGGMRAYYGANFHSVTDKGHWIEVIASIYKKGDTLDHELEAEVRRRILSEQDAALIRQR